MIEIPGALALGDCLPGLMSKLSFSRSVVSQSMTATL